MDLKFVEDKVEIEGEQLHMDLGDSLSSPRTTSFVMCVVNCTHATLEDPHT